MDTAPLVRAMIRTRSNQDPGADAKPNRAQTLAAAALAALLAFAGSVPLVGAWANGPDNGNGYGTHDWILDQALHLLDERGIGHGWVDSSIALEATDDPDTVEVAADPSRKIEHTYTATGRRGGAIHRITEHYAKILRALDANDDDEASYQLGMLAHFWGDIAQPYHTAQAAQDFDGEHSTYEHLVDDLTDTIDDAPSWSAVDTSWDVSNMPNVRTAAVALAAYSRARYDDIHDHLDAGDGSLSDAAKATTKELMIRATGSLADLIYSAGKGIGNAPPVGSLQLWARWHGVKGNEANQLIYGRVRDVNGDLMEGVRVDVTFPTAAGRRPGSSGPTTPARATSASRSAIRRSWPRRTSAARSRRTRPPSTTATGITARRSSPTRTRASGRTSATGASTPARQVTIKTYVRTTEGKPIAGLLVDWTWDLGGAHDGHHRLDGLERQGDDARTSSRTARRTRRSTSTPTRARTASTASPRPGSSETTGPPAGPGAGAIRRAGQPR